MARHKEVCGQKKVKGGLGRVSVDLLNKCPKWLESSVTCFQEIHM